VLATWWQKQIADRRAEKWRRLSWAFDHSLSSDPDEVDFGWLMIEHLSTSKPATSDDKQLFQAVAERWNSGDTEATPSEGGRP